MAIDYLNGRIQYLHTIPTANGELVNARIQYLHTIPTANGELVNARIQYLHTIPTANGELVNARLQYLHTLPPPPGVYGSGADAIAALPNSGAVSPFKSNRDAARALK